MKTQTSVASDGIVFTRETRAGKLEAEKELFIVPMDDEKAVEALRTEVGQRGNVTRAALSAIIKVLQDPGLDSYKGQGDINAPEGAKLPKEMKEGVRAAERAHFIHAYKDIKKLDGFLSGLREAGIYATVKGVCLKYFWFAGKLPCSYNDDGTPDTGKLLSVSAMQKLLANMVEDKPKADDSIAARLGSLLTEFTESEDLDENAMQIILARLGVFTQEVKEALNIIAANKTENTALMAPSVKTLDEQIKAELDAIDAEAAELGIELVE